MGGLPPLLPSLPKLFQALISPEHPTFFDLFELAVWALLFPAFPNYFKLLFITRTQNFLI
jgi:hypothetical protein